jgi:hypothetical protein
VSTSVVRIVVTDSNVLINLMHVSRLDLCGRIPGHEFVVPDHVREEDRDGKPRTLARSSTFGALTRFALLKAPNDVRIDGLVERLKVKKHE